MLVDKISCTGCSACFSVCPTGAIVMQQDDEGFFHPAIDAGKCISCRLCEKACPLMNPVETRPVREVYACYSVENSNRMDSSSGGVFSVLAEQVLKNGGVVFGATFDGTYHALHHVGIEDAAELAKLRGSKYVQSNLRNVFREIQKLLREKKYVLFVGTPCQVAGLRNVAKQNIAYLLTAEFVCHGVPSPAVWARFLREITPDKSKVRDLRFRDKKMGWTKYSMKVLFENGNVYLSNVEENPYLQGFLSGLYMRASCYKCPFRKKQRIGDFMMGDCWGIEHMTDDARFLTNEGVSLLSIQSDLGKAVWQMIQSRLYVKKIDYIQAMKYNRAIISDSYHHLHREKFFKRMEQEETSISRIIQEESSLNIWERIQRRLWGTGELMRNWCIRNFR